MLEISNEMEKYQLLKESFIKGLRALEKTGVIHSLFVSEEFEQNQNIKEFPLLPRDCSIAEEFARKMPYSDTFECRNIPLVSCHLTGVDDFVLSLGIMNPYEKYLNAYDAFGIGICCKYGENLSKKRYITSADVHSWSYETVNKEGVRDSFIDFQLLLNKAIKFENENVAN